MCKCFRLIDASSVNVDMNLRLLMNANYHRLDPLLPWKINLDNTDAMDELVKAAEEADVEVSERRRRGRVFRTRRRRRREFNQRS